MITRIAIGSLLFYFGIVALTLFPSAMIWLYLLTLTKTNAYIGVGSPLNLVLATVISVVLGLFLVRGGIEHNPELSVQRRRTIRRAITVVILTFLLSMVI